MNDELVNAVELLRQAEAMMKAALQSGKMDSAEAHLTYQDAAVYALVSMAEDVRRIAQTVCCDVVEVHVRGDGY